MFCGVEILTDTDFFSDREKFSSLAKKCLFTGMIDEFFGYCLGELDYRSLRFETETLDTDNFQGVAVMNFSERDIPYTRIIEHKHFNFGRQEKTVITREYPEVFQRGKEPYYPVNDEKNNGLYEKYRRLAQQREDVIFGGRLGLYKYYDMDKCIEAALEICEKEFSK